MQSIFVVFFHESFVKQHSGEKSEYFFTGKKKPAFVRQLILNQLN
jgi:hypothetical protein